mmetsp:Transcript_99722/g.282443  ORF Transcript_99722/g.282443 Transcript_99722/m.282443 type:complete len:282 (+) Transcript_99722:1245-2090(+)
MPSKCVMPGNSPPVGDHAILRGHAHVEGQQYVQTENHVHHGVENIRAPHTLQEGKLQRCEEDTEGHNYGHENVPRLVHPVVRVYHRVPREDPVVVAANRRVLGLVGALRHLAHGLAALPGHGAQHVSFNAGFLGIQARQRHRVPGPARALVGRELGHALDLARVQRGAHDAAAARGDAAPSAAVVVRVVALAARVAARVPARVAVRVAALRGLLFRGGLLGFSEPPSGGALGPGGRGDHPRRLSLGELGGGRCKGLGVLARADLPHPLRVRLAILPLELSD